MATATSNATDNDFASVGKKPGDQIQCVVVTPERTLFDELVEFVALPLLDGELGILPGRAPLLGRLGYGELRTKAHGNAQRYFIDGGFAQVRDNVVTVLTNRALPVGQLDAATATADLEKARSRTTGNEQEAAERTRLMDRARAMIRVAGATPKA